MMNPDKEFLGRNRTCRTVLVGLLAIFFFLISCPSALASSTASISGTVSDPSGAVVAGATVILRDSEHRVQQSSATNDHGSYAFPELPPGHYRIEVLAPGFKLYLRADLELGTADAFKIDPQLALNAESTIVEVSANSLQADTSTSQIGETIAGKKITGVPLNGRGFTDLLAIQPGVLPASSQQPNAVVMAGCATTPPSGDLNPGNLSVSGQRETANGFVLNGSNVEEDFNRGTAIVPNLDSIQEFRVLTSYADAEYGNYSGGQVIVVTKSGSNQLHGSVFEFLRNTNLDSRNYFSAQRAKFDRHQFGGTVGGPLKKGAIFFFADYQGTRMTQGIESGRISVPSIADRTGNLIDEASALTTTATLPNGSRVTVPTTVAGSNLASLPHVSPGLPYYFQKGENQAGNPTTQYAMNCTLPSQCVFPNAVFPQNAWSAPAKALLQYIPQPNQGDANFSTSVYNQTLRDNEGALRVDANTGWGALAAYYSLDDFFQDTPYPTGQGGANVPGFNATSVGRAQLFSLGITKALSPNALNEFHLSYMRFANRVGQPVGGVGPKLSDQGFVEGPGTLGIVPLAPKIEGIENVSFNDFTFGVDTTGETQVNNTYQETDNFSKVMGKHSLKVGGGLHLDQVNINPDAVFNGSFQFEGTESGSDFADFLLGAASYYRQGDSKSFYLRNKYVGLFAQDSWQVRPNVALTYGLRWDVLPPWSEKYSQLQTLVLGQQSVVYPGAPQGLVFPGDPGIPRTLAPTRHANFAPRLGLAYSPKSRNGLLEKIVGSAGTTSVRAGYGVFYSAFEGLSAGIMSANPPYGYDYDSSTIGPPLFATPFVAAATGLSLGQPFPSPIPAYGASASHPNTTVDWSKYDPITGVPSFFRGNVSPYTESYTLSVQRQVSANTLLSIGYIGNQAHHLLVLQSANPGNAQLCLKTPGCGPFSETSVRGPFNSHFDAVTYQKTIGNSNYNALEASLRHHGGPLEFMVGYTYSKSIDQSSDLAEPVYPVAIDASGKGIGPSLNRAISAFDMTHNFVASYRYELPFGHLSQNHDRLTKGWVVSGITRFSTGFPVTLFNNNDTSLLGTIPNGINNNGVDSPSLTPGNLEINTDPRNGRSAFNTSLFTLPALGQVGTARRRFFDGPGISNFDMALEKNLELSESKSLEFRLEAFNVFNHAQFYGPSAVNGNISSANFGQVVSAAPPRLVQLAAKFFF
jgi:Carboxypeptidase regulatory-like domain